MMSVVVNSVLQHLRARAAGYRDRFMAAKPFRFVVMDDFLPTDIAEAILQAYPSPDKVWDGTTYVHQRKKFTLTKNLPPECQDFFDLSASPEFLEIISQITDIQNLIPDAELVGAGLHQIVDGGYLDVHVDFNLHPSTGLHRRCNLLVYLNKDWKRDYEGYLELWDMSQNLCMESVAPVFNRGVLFETNEVSYHGHPKPLRTPMGVSRKSLSVYYYTSDRDISELAPEHNTIYRHTDGLSSYVKAAGSAITAFRERLARRRGSEVLKGLGTKIWRALRRLPPPNG